MFDCVEHITCFSSGEALKGFGQFVPPTSIFILCSGIERLWMDILRVNSSDAEVRMRHCNVLV